MLGDRLPNVVAIARARPSGECMRAVEESYTVCALRKKEELSKGH
jgi:hypothetical protein